MKGESRGLPRSFPCNPELMQYRANPVLVEAHKIVLVGEIQPAGGRELHIQTTGAATSQRQIHADAGMLARYTPVGGDYWVQQEDGYIYLNPKEVFERKYSPVIFQAVASTPVGEPIHVRRPPSYADRVRPSPFSEAWIDDVCGYHNLTDSGLVAVANIRRGTAAMLRVIDENCPSCADRSAAVRHVRDAMMTANAAVALQGLI